MFSGIFKSCTDAFLFVKNSKIQTISKPSLFRYIKFIFYLLQAPVQSVQKLKFTKIFLKNHSLNSIYFLLTDENQEKYTSKTISKDQHSLECEILGDFVLDCFISENRNMKRIFSFTYNTLMIKKEISVKRDHLDYIDDLEIDLEGNFEMILCFEETWKVSQTYENDLLQLLSYSPKNNLGNNFKTKLEHVAPKHRANMGLVSRELDEFKLELLSPIQKKRKEAPKPDTPKKVQKKNESPLKEHKLVEIISQLKLEDKKQKFESPKKQKFEIPKLNLSNVEIPLPPSIKEVQEIEMKEKNSPKKFEIPKLNVSNIPKPPDLTVPKAPRGNPTLVSPRRGLKKIHWKPLNERSIEKQSVWSTFKFEEQSFNIDHGKLEDLFSIQENTKTQKEVKENQIVNTIHLIGINRARNIEIILKKMRSISEKRILDIIDKLEVNHIDMDTLKCIQGLIPTKEEEEQLKKYKGNIQDLSNIDQFLLKLSKIERIREKMKTLEFALITYETSRNELLKNMNQRRNLFNQVRSSQKFQKVLELVLAVGNFLNEQKSKGFKLDILLQLNSVKSRDGKTNLMEFITMTCIQEKVDDFYMDLELEDKLSISDFEEEIKKYKVIYEHFDKEVRFYQDGNELSEKIFKFYTSSKENFEKLKENLDQLKSTFDQLMKHFGEDKKDTEFLSLLKGFIKEFQKSKETIKRKKLI